MSKENGPWTIKSSDCKYESAHIEVWEDQVVRPDGKPGRYATVSLHSGVSILPIDQDGFVYLTRQFRYALGAESTEVASGSMDDGNEPPVEAARRELHEELGIQAATWTEMGMVHMNTSMIRGSSRQFLAQDLSFTEAEREGTETIETVKVPLDEAVRMVWENEITHALSCLLILQVQNHLQGERAGKPG